jgi:hypothetical protein
MPAQVVGVMNETDAPKSSDRDTRPARSNEENLTSRGQNS